MTPGPWRVSEYDRAVVCGNDGRLVALALRDLNNNTADCRYKNAAVLAAAPELHELLEGIAALPEDMRLDTHGYFVTARLLLDRLRSQCTTNKS